MDRSLGALILGYAVTIAAGACGARSGLGHREMLSAGGSASAGQGSVATGLGGADVAGGAPHGGTSSCENGPRLFDLPATDIRGAPLALLAADINGDGLSDLVAANASISALTVLLGNGNGTFAPPVEYPVADGPVAIASVDVDRDGRADLISVGQATDSISVLLGDGRGAFADHYDLSIMDRAGSNPAQPVALAVGDLNHDDWPDLAIADRGIAKVSVMLGSGGGKFAEGSTYDVGGVPESIALGDFNADGTLDLANASRGDGAVNVLLGNGDGTFGKRTDWVIGTPTRWISAADFNADGRLDLAALTEGTVVSKPVIGPNIAVLYGLGNGGFAPAVTYPIESSNWPFVVGDVNRDGTSDLVVPEGPRWSGFATAGGPFAALLGKRGGTFEHGPTNSHMLFAECSTLGDFDHDGILDLLTGGAYRTGLSNWQYGPDIGSFVVAFGQGNGYFGTAADLPFGDTAVDLALHDLNGDGKLDLVAVDDENDAIAVSLGDGRGGFVAVDSSPSSTRRAPLFGDVNDDGIPDLLVINGSGIRALLGAGDGTFPTSVDSAPLRPAPGYSMDIEQIASGYVNADGQLDVVATASETKLASGTLLPMRAVVLTGFGDGSLGYFDSWRTNRMMDIVALEDLDGDGRLDLVQGGNAPASVSVSMGGGDGTFKTTFEIGIGMQRPASMAFGDLNRDGLLDLAMTGIEQNMGSALLTVLLGAGGGDLRMVAQQYLRDPGTGPVALADVNGDGRLDAITAGRGFYVALGDGNGTFDCVQHYASGVEVNSMASGDIDGDGRPDVVVAGTAGSITAFLNQGR